MYRFVVCVALRQHAPLSTRVENKKIGFENFANRGRLATWTTGWNVFLQKMVPDTLPLFVT